VESLTTAGLETGATPSCSTLLCLVPELFLALRVTLCIPSCVFLRIRK